MYRTYSIRLQPNAAQRAKLALYLERLRELYNMALEQRRDAWKVKRKGLSYYDQSKELTELHHHPDYQSIPVAVCRDALRRLDKAYKRFFARVAAKKTPGFPRFKGTGRYESFSVDGSDFTFKAKCLRIRGLGQVGFKTHREPQGVAHRVTIIRDGDKWRAAVGCYIGEAPPKKVVSRAVGIDLGLMTLVTLSDGEEIANLRWRYQNEGKLGSCNRTLSRKHFGSANWQKAKEALRRAHQRAANCRTNYLHHVSKWLVANYDLIAHEKLSIRNMAQSFGARSVIDAAWGQLLYDLNYKAEEAGVHVIAVNPSGTSQRCSGCGAIVKKTLAEREHRCECGVVLGRDHNAALNILKLGETALGRSAVAQAARASEDALPDLARH